jgi:hypothetical protein
MTDQQATPVIDAEREIGRAVFRRIAELRIAQPRSPQVALTIKIVLTALEAIVLAVTGEKG